MAEQHRHRVQGVVLRRKDRRLAPAIPIERGVQHRLGEISDRLPVGPHPLALEPAGDRVAPVRRLDIPHLRQLGIAEQDIPDDEGHLHLELQFRGLLRRRMLQLGGVFVQPFLPAGFHPRQRLFIFLMVIDAGLDAAQHFRHIHPLRADPQIFLEKVGVAVASHDPHRHAADVDVAFAPHLSHRRRAFRETHDFLRHVLRDGVVLNVLHVVPVDRIRRQAPLRVGRHHRRQIHGARAFGPVEAPHRLDRRGIHVHRLTAVTPAGRHRQRRDHVFPAELLRGPRRLRAAADALVRDHAFHRASVGVPHPLRDQRRGRLRHLAGLLFQPFSHPEPPSVDDRPDPDFRVDAPMIHTAASLFCFMAFSRFMTSLPPRPK